MAPSTLIGRERALADVEQRVREARLVTLVGPGGVGKTAMAIEIAERLGGEFPHGSRWVDLTRIDDGDAVPGAVAAQLGYDSFESLMVSPGDHPVLLVVDNCEHVLEAAAATVMDVLGSCRQPSIVATSRSPLDLPGESVVGLAPLPLPLPQDDPTHNASVQLFLARCRDAGRELDDADLATVVELCRRLDGLPLALEIAAARTRTAAVAEILDRLDGGAEVLARPRFRGDPRHRSVTDTIRWSYDLLSPQAATTLRSLAVCHGAFDRDLARAITAEPDGGPDLDERLDELVHASLLVVDPGSATSYRMLDTIRRFALDQLEHDGELDAAQDRLVDHVVASTRRTVSGSTQTWRPTLLRDLAGSYDDLAGALQRCNDLDTDPRRALALCSVLWGIVHQGRADDIVRLARRTVERWPDDGSAAYAQCVAALATAEYVTGDAGRAIELASAALDSLERPGLPSVTLRRVIGQASAALGRFDDALRSFDDGAAAGRQLDMSAMAIELDVAAAVVLADIGRVDEAIERATAAVDEARRLGSELSECWARTALGWITLRRDPTDAGPIVRVALEQARHLDYPIAVAVGIRSSAYASLLTGDVAGAARHVGALLDELLERGALSNQRVLVDVAAALAVRADHQAAPMLTATLATLPITTLASSAYQLIDLPAGTAPALSRREAVSAVRTVVSDVLADAIPDDAPGVAPGVDGGEPAPPTTNVFRLRGELYEITYRGRTLTTRRSKGLADLARLLSEPGREIHCLDLADAAVTESSTGVVADATARRQYEERIRELQEDIDEAESLGDYGRSYRAQVELDALIDHLTSIVGRGGKDRRGVSTTERARSAVTHRIRAAIAQFPHTHPELARHLANSISTGTYCAYRPESPTTWQAT